MLRADAVIAVREHRIRHHGCGKAARSTTKRSARDPGPDEVLFRESALQAPGARDVLEASFVVLARREHQNAGPSLDGDRSGAALEGVDDVRTSELEVVVAGHGAQRSAADRAAAGGRVDMRVVVALSPPANFAPAFTKITAIQAARPTAQVRATQTTLPSKRSRMKCRTRRGGFIRRPRIDVVSTFG